MTITTNKANELFNEVKERGTLIKEERGAITYNLDGWTYTFFFYNGIKKIEESNHREFIEVWVK